MQSLRKLDLSPTLISCNIKFSFAAIDFSLISQFREWFAASISRGRFRTDCCFDAESMAVPRVNGLLAAAINAEHEAGQAANRS